MKISQIDVYQVDLPYAGGTYRLSGGREYSSFDATIVRLTSDTGLTGFGESTPFGATYIAAHALGVRAGIEEIAPAILGLDPRRVDRVYDAMNAALVGHGHAKVRAALHAQLDQLAYAHTSFFTSEPAEKLANKLIAHAPNGIERVYLVSSGSEAVEAALKLARQYFTETGQPQRHRIIARRQSYHGNTLGALASGGNAWRRKQFSPLLIDTTHIAPCYDYRDRAEDETAFEYGQRVANELETEINRLGPDSVMAFIAEPVVGATAGAVPPVAGYL